MHFTLGNALEGLGRLALQLVTKPLTERGNSEKEFKFAAI